jgi:hypothetical protein
MQNREGEMAYLRGLAPTTLEESRRQQLEATMLNPLRGSQPAAAPLRKEIPGHPGTFAISTDGGVTWKAE